MADQHWPPGVAAIRSRLSAGQDLQSRWQSLRPPSRTRTDAFRSRRPALGRRTLGGNTREVVVSASAAKGRQSLILPILICVNPDLGEGAGVQLAEAGFGRAAAPSGPAWTPQALPIGSRSLPFLCGASFTFCSEQASAWCCFAKPARMPIWTGMPQRRALTKADCRGLWRPIHEIGVVFLTHQFIHQVAQGPAFPSLQPVVIGEAEGPGRKKADQEPPVERFISRRSSRSRLLSCWRRPGHPFSVVCKSLGGSTAGVFADRALV